MDILAILFGTILGMFLAIGDQMAHHHRRLYGFHAGLNTWLWLTAAPLIVVISSFWQIAVVGMLVGFILSGLLILQEKAKGLSQLPLE